ncbi:hypothetical protein BDR26DRAFT_867363 [Obelidium mucronatum]|nr:hypothetical protein BDR26DRAFT_867363 [Obelidium mucronatum]
MGIPSEYIVYASFAMALVSLLELLWLVHFIVYHEIVQRGKKVTLKEVFTPFSSLLILIALSHIGLYISEGGSTLLRPQQTPMFFVFYTLEDMFGVGFEACYIYYSYLRAEPIFDQVFPSIAKFVSFAVRVSPILFSMQWLPFPISKLQFKDPQVSKTISMAGDVITMINGTLLVAFDTLCLVTFIRYIQSTQINDGITDSRFLIICRYGITSVSVCLSGLGFFVAYLISEEELCAFIVYMHFSGLFVILFRMKVALHRDKVAKDNERLSKIESVAAGYRGRQRTNISPVSINESEDQSVTNGPYQDVTAVMPRKLTAS